MKRKLIYALTVLLLVSASCKKEEVIKEKTAKMQLIEADKATKAIIKNAFSQLQGGALKDHLFANAVPNGDDDPQGNPSPFTTYSQVPGLTATSDTFLANLSFRNEGYAEDDYADALSDFNADHASIMNQTTFTNDDIIRLSAVNYGIELIGYMNAENFESYYPNLVTYGGENPGFRSMRADGCKVNTRAVLEEAVWGFFSGGLGGALAGCTGGTVVLPIIGTASGCVGGAVFGAAAGFTSNAVKQIAKDLLRTCFR